MSLSNVSINIGNFTDRLTDKNRNSPPKIGSIITYKFQELSKSGSPRFPTFVGEIYSSVLWVIIHGLIHSLVVAPLAGDPYNLNNPMRKCLFKCLTSAWTTEKGLFLHCTICSFPPLRNPPTFFLHNWIFHTLIFGLRIGLQYYVEQT